MKELDRNFLYILLVTVISFAFYFELVFLKNIYIFRDLSTILLPLQKTVLNLLIDSFPLWNPYQVLGKPLFADPLSGLQYPPNIIFYFFNQPYTYNLSIVFHHIVAAFGFYLLLRKLNFGFESSALSGLIFSFSGIMVSQDNMINALQSSTWAPFVLCYFISFLKEFKNKDFFKLIIFYTLCFLGGMPEICIYLNFFFVFIALYYKNIISMKSSLFAIFKANLFLLGLSSFFLLPFLEYVKHSTRSAGLIDKAIINLSHNPINTLGFFIPRFLVDKNGLFKESSSFFFGYYSTFPWAISIYLGIASIFIIFAIYFSKGKQVIFFGLIFLFFLLLSFGGYLPYYGEVISNFPILNLSRYPEKYLYCTSGILVFSLAFGMDSVFKNLKKPAYFFVPLLLIILFDLYAVNLKQLPVISFKEYEKKPVTLAKIENKDRLTRIYNNEFRALKNVKTHKEVFKVKKALLMHVIANQYKLANLNSPASLNLENHEKIISKIANLNKSEVINHLKNLSINYVTSQNKLVDYPDLVNVFYDDKTSVYLYKLNHSKPRAYLKNQKSKVEIVSYEANNVLLKANTSKPDTLVLNDTFYPGWSVFVNGEKRKLININGVRGVKLNKELNHVEFRFFPVSLIFGSLISVLSFCYLLLIRVK